MAVDFGRLNINSAGTAEKFSGDLAAQAVIRAGSVVTMIEFRAPAANSGNVFIGRLGRDGSTATVTRSYGITLVPGGSLQLLDIHERFSNFQGNAASTNDDIEWVAEFTSGRSIS